RTEIGVALVDGGILCPPVSFTNGVRLRNPPYPQVAGANGANLAGFDQAIERLHGFFEGSIRVIAMRIVQIDSVGLQSSLAFLALASDLGGIQAPGRSWVVESQLCGDHHLVASAAVFHPGANGCFAFSSLAIGKPGCIKISGIDESPAPLVEDVEQAERRF